MRGKSGEMESFVRLLLILSEVLSRSLQAVLQDEKEQLEVKGRKGFKEGGIGGRVGRGVLYKLGLKKEATTRLPSQVRSCGRATISFPSACPTIAFV